MNDPVAFFASLGVDAAIGDVLAWIAVAVSSGVGLVFLALGIRKGVAFFMSIVEERRIGGTSAVGGGGDPLVMSQFRAWRDAHGEGAVSDVVAFASHVFDDALRSGMSVDDANAAADYSEAQVRKHHGI